MPSLFLSYRMQVALIVGAAVLLVALAAAYFYSRNKPAPKTILTQPIPRPTPTPTPKPTPTPTPTPTPKNTDPLPDVAKPKDPPTPGSNTAVVTPPAAPDLSIQTFARVGQSSYTPPDGVTKVRVSVLGGGGGGGNGAASSDFAEPGHPGALVQKTVAVTPGVPIMVTVGAGGAGVKSSGYSSSGVGGSGGNSSFGSVVAAGGAGGARAGAYGGPAGSGVWIDGVQVGWQGVNCDTGTDCISGINAKGVGAGGGRLDNYQGSGCGDGEWLCNSLSGAGASGLVRVEPQA
jgi:hypothetical protein